mmetsp:Transcript_1682/g.4558  ORF Transcript_1682/g.4558 Transcript_1682/m.4558 type:complete len:204 (+) Transcript_1682:178-789(+)
MQVDRYIFTGVLGQFTFNHFGIHIPSATDVPLTFQSNFARLEDLQRIDPESGSVLHAFRLERKNSTCGAARSSQNEQGIVALHSGRLLYQSWRVVDKQSWTTNVASNNVGGSLELVLVPRAGHLLRQQLSFWPGQLLEGLHGLCLESLCHQDKALASHATSRGYLSSVWDENRPAPIEIVLHNLNLRLRSKAVDESEGFQKCT